MSNYEKTSHLVTKLKNEHDFDVLIGKVAGGRAIEVVFPLEIMADRDKGVLQVKTMTASLEAELKRQGLPLTCARCMNKFTLSLPEKASLADAENLFDVTKRFFINLQNKVEEIGLENAVDELPGGSVEPDLSHVIRPGARRYASALVAARRDFMSILGPRGQVVPVEGFAVGGADMIAGEGFSVAERYEKIADPLVEVVKGGRISLADARQEVEAIFSGEKCTGRLDDRVRQGMVTALAESCAKHAARIEASKHSGGRERQ